MKVRRLRAVVPVRVEKSSNPEKCDLKATNTMSAEGMKKLCDRENEPTLGPALFSLAPINS